MEKLYWPKSSLSEVNQNEPRGESETASIIVITTEKYIQCSRRDLLSEAMAAVISSQADGRTERLIGGEEAAASPHPPQQQSC